MGGEARATTSGAHSRPTPQDSQDRSEARDRAHTLRNLPVSGSVARDRCADGLRPASDKELITIAANVASSNGIGIKKGVYVGVKGPSYETAAEVEMIHRIGADTVGMSTVFEVSLANRLGMKGLGISCITNYASEIRNAKAWPLGNYNG